MKSFYILMIALVLSLIACASLKEKGRMEDLKDTADAYEHALLRADFRTAAGFIDPTARPADTRIEKYKKIKIVDCRTTRVKVSEDKMTVKKDVELQYFLVDRNILQSTRYQQKWHYDEEKKAWLLESGLPAFDN